jgi:hypothetical protein
MDELIDKMDFACYADFTRLLRILHLWAND